MTQRLRLIISGDVQGVGYRAWARRLARAASLTGWVQNREDGAVELVAEGKERDLQTFLAACRRGPEVAGVKNVVATWGSATGEFVNFSVIY